MANSEVTQTLSPAQLSQLQDYLGINLVVLQNICDTVSQRVPCDISIMAAGGVIVASSIPGRLGNTHEGAARILRGELPCLDVSAEMERRSAVMLEGCNQPVELDGTRIASVGITAPLARAQEYASIVQICIEQMLQAHLANWRNNQQLSAEVKQTRQALRDENAEKQIVKASLLRSEQRLREISDYMFDSIWETDADHRFSYVTESMMDCLGMRIEDVVGKTRWEVMEPFLINQDENSWRQHREDMQNHRNFRDFSYTLKTPRGEIKHLLISGKAIYGEQNTFVGYRGAAKDVTHHHDIQEALRESETRFKNIAESSSDWIWVMDERLRFNYISDRFFEITGLQLDDIIGKTRGEFVGADIVAADPEKWQLHFEDLSHWRRIKEFDYHGYRPDGQRYCIKINGSPYFRSDGSFAGYHGTGTDYTELNHAKEQLLRNEKLAALGGMVAGVAHEINTPVGNALTAASHFKEESLRIHGLIESGQLTRSMLLAHLKESEESTDILLQNLGRAIHLIDNFKQVAVDQSSDQIRSFKLAQYIEGVHLSLQSPLKQGRHQLSINCDPQLELHSAPGALYQVLSNLVMNSITHGFANRREGCMNFDVSEHPQLIQIDYSDNGVGMDEEQKRRLFEPFYTTRRGSGSTGLGMYLIHNLVYERLQGTVCFESDLDKGVRFTLKLPKRLETR
ncbi:MAG: PAS domain S-box protein [Motiliproteus sp.]|nr:PAS domain S-box protein [Motiliproteus sp.]MCW9050733.1 PAS domain S-box protein [Motiliproteus sp.]